MVEAVLVIAVMVVFLGLTLFTYKSYSEKLDQQTQTRSEALRIASHHCSGEAGGETSDTGFGMEQGGDIGGRMMGGSMQSAVVMTSVTRTGSATVNGSAVLDRERVPLTRQIRSWSTTVCSPQPTTWGGLLNQGLSGLRSLVGG